MCPWVWVPDGVDTRTMHRYVTALVELMQLPNGPDELGIRQLCEELDEDPDMYSAVWAHLYNWQRNMIRDIRAKAVRQTEHIEYKDWRHQ